MAVPRPPYPPLLSPPYGYSEVKSHTPVSFDPWRIHLPMTRQLISTLASHLPSCRPQTLPVDPPRRGLGRQARLREPSRSLILSRHLAQTPPGESCRPRQVGMKISQTGMQKADEHGLLKGPHPGPILSGQRSTRPGLSKGNNPIGRDLTRDYFHSRLTRASFGAHGGRHGKN